MSIGFDTDYNKRVYSQMMKSYDTDINQWEPTRIDNSRLIGGSYIGGALTLGMEVKRNKNIEYVQSGGLPSYPQLNAVEIKEWDNMKSYPYFAFQGGAFPEELVGANGPHCVCLNNSNIKSEGGVKSRGRPKKTRLSQSKDGDTNVEEAVSGESGETGTKKKRGRPKGSKKSGTENVSGGNVSRSGGNVSRSGGKISYTRIWNTVKPFVKKYGRRLISQGRQPLTNALTDLIGDREFANVIVNEIANLAEDVLEGMGYDEKYGGNIFKKIWKKVKPVAKPLLKVGVKALKTVAKPALEAVLAPYGVNPMVTGVLVDALEQGAQRGIEGLGYEKGVGKYGGVSKSGGVSSGGMSNVKKRAELVKKVMKDKGMNLGQASKYIKQNKLM